MTSIEFEVRALLDRRIEACQVKDIDRLMALYAPHIVYFDVVPPNQFRGTDEARRNFLRWFDEYDGPIGLETHELNIAISGNVAFAHMLHLDSGTRKAGVAQGEVWLRSTVCCQRSRGKRLITHEHVSLPIGWKENA